MKPIKWIAIDFDDFKAEPEPGYMLRVEQMNEHMWWWTVYGPDGDALEDPPMATDEESAKHFAEQTYYKMKSPNHE